MGQQNTHDVTFGTKRTSSFSLFGAKPIVIKEWSPMYTLTHSKKVFIIHQVLYINILLQKKAFVLICCCYYYKDGIRINIMR